MTPEELEAIRAAARTDHEAHPPPPLTERQISQLRRLYAAGIARGGAPLIRGEATS